MLAENGKMALAALSRGAVDLLISDIKMPDMSGVEVLRSAKQIDPALPAIMMTAFASTETAVEAMRLGACDYLVKPFDVDELKLKVREKLESRHLRQENVLLKRALNEPHAFAGIIGRSSPMLAVFDLVESVAAHDEHRAHHGRVGHRQGTGRARASSAVAAARSSLCGAQLRRAHRDAARVRAVRPHEGQLHRGRRDQEGADRRRRGRHDFPRRDRRDHADDAGEAAARAAGAQVPARRRAGRSRGRHPRGRGDQPGPAEDGGRGPVPRGPLLPHQRHSDSAAAAARPAGRHPAHRRPLPGEVPAGDGQVHRDDLG